MMNNIKFFNDISDEEVFNAVQDVGLEEFVNKFPKKYNFDGELSVGIGSNPPAI